MEGPSKARTIRDFEDQVVERLEDGPFALAHRLLAYPQHFRDFELGLPAPVKFLDQVEVRRRQPSQCFQEALDIPEKLGPGPGRRPVTHLGLPFPAGLHPGDLADGVAPARDGNGYRRGA